MSLRKQWVQKRSRQLQVGWLALIVIANGALTRSSGAADSAQSFAKPPRLRTMMSLDFGSNLATLGTSDHAADMSVSIAPMYRLNEQWTAGVGVALIQVLTQEKNFLWSDASLRLNHSAIRISPYLNVMPTVSAILPITERSLQRESLITAVRGASRLMLDFSRVRALENASLSYELSAVRAFHQYQTATTGSVNTEYRLAQWVSAGYSLSDHWSISADFIRSSSWDYDGVDRHAFSLGETLIYSFGSGTSISMGLTNEGNVLRANGRDSNIAVIDSVSSRLFTSFSVIF